jgi:hypothetical protein
MPDENGLYGSSAVTQGALIVPAPGDANSYYLFTAAVCDSVAAMLPTAVGVDE